jgi:hypothetical protein
MYINNNNAIYVLKVFCFFLGVLSQYDSMMLLCYHDCSLYMVG